MKLINLVQLKLNKIEKRFSFFGNWKENLKDKTTLIREKLISLFMLIAHS